MELKAYLKHHRMTEAAFARELGVKQSTVNRLCNGALPTRKTAARIAKLTKRRVMPNDFYDLAVVPRNRSKRCDSSKP